MTNKTYAVLSPETQTVARADRRARLIVIAAATGYVLFFSVLSIRKYDVFEAGYDLAIFNQAVWLLGHGLSQFVTVRGVDAFGDHFDPGLYLFAPLGALGLGPKTLLVVQSIGLALPAPLLFALARQRGASPAFAAVVPLLWLVSPLTHALSLADFHPDAFLPALVAGGALALERRHTGVFVVSAVVAMSLKEDVSLLYLGWALVLALDGRRRLAASLGVGSLAWFLLASTVAIPAFGGDHRYYVERFCEFCKPLTLVGLATGEIAHPGHFLGNLTMPVNARLLIGLVGSTAGFCLLAPRFIIVGLPTLAANLIADYTVQHDFLSYYHAIPAAAFAVAGAMGAARAEMLVRRRPPKLERLLAVVVILGAAAGFLHASPVVWTVRDAYRQTDAKAVDARREALELVPAGADVAAQIDMVPHLSGRREIYALPEPIVNRTDRLPPSKTWNARELARRVAGIEFVILDDGPLGMTAEDDARMRRRLRQLPFVALSCHDGVTVLERRTALRQSARARKYGRAAPRCP
jgi:uncharacterized membrane protein